VQNPIEHIQTGSVTNALKFPPTINKKIMQRENGQQQKRHAPMQRLLS
jgi:hypothetical protein